MTARFPGIIVPVRVIRLPPAQNMSPLFFIKRRCLYDMHEHVLWFHLRLVSLPNGWTLKALFGLNIKDVSKSRLRMTFHNGTGRLFSRKNGIEQTNSFQNTKGTRRERPRGFIPPVQTEKVNLHQWEKDAVWVGKDGR